MFARLKAIGEDFDAVHHDLHRRVPSQQMFQLKALDDTCFDVVMMMYLMDTTLGSFQGKNPKVMEIWPEGGHDVEDKVIIWASDPAGHKRPQWTAVAMTATFLCSALEGFIRGLEELAVRDDAIARVRAAFPEAGIAWSELTRASKEIRIRIRPSAKGDGRFLTYMEAVFGLSVDVDIRAALASLVWFRNAIVHPSRGRSHDEHEKVPHPDQYMTWLAAVRVLTQKVMRALADRLDERRARGELIPLFPHHTKNPGDM